MVVYGGTDFYDADHVYHSDDAWDLSLADPPRWRQLPSAPIHLLSHRAIYDAPRDRMVVFGGIGGIEMGESTLRNDTWVLQWGPPSAASLRCPNDAIIPGFSTINEMSLVGFRITNVGAGPSQYLYMVSGDGPATLVDKGNPLSLIGVTPVLDPGASYYPPEAALLIPETRDLITHHVTYRVFDAANSTCTTTIVTEPPVPVLISAFNGKAVQDGVELSWRVELDTPIAGFRVCRALGGEQPCGTITPTLLPADARRYTDRGVTGGTEYRYTLEVVLSDGSAMRSSVVTVQTKGYALTLDQNVPNPFNPRTVISFTLPAQAKVTLAVYNVEGKLVRMLLDSSVGVGRHEYTWDGTDVIGAPVSSGVYFCRLTGSERTLTRKMVLLK